MILFVKSNRGILFLHSALAVVKEVIRRVSTLTRQLLFKSKL